MESCYLTRTIKITVILLKKSNVIGNVCLSLGEIYWIGVGYEDSPGESKVRPAIIVSEEDDALLILVATTSVPPHDPPKYHDQFKIPILNWRKAGLLKPSWV